MAGADREGRGRQWRELPGTDPCEGLGPVCKFGIAQAVPSITGGHGSKAGSAQWGVTSAKGAPSQTFPEGRLWRLIVCASATDEAEPVGLVQ
jgi:hypothetical protein